MTVRLMEGFETTYSVADLQAHGWVNASSASPFLQGPGRYAGGSGLYRTTRVTPGTYAIRKLVGPFSVGGGLSFSLVGRSGGPGASFSTISRIRKFEGDYFFSSFSSNTVSSSIVQLSSDFQTATTHSNASLILGPALLWDPNRELWIRVGHSNGTLSSSTLSIIATSDLNDPGTVVNGSAGGIGQIGKLFLTQEGHIFCMPQARLSTTQPSIIALANGESPTTASNWVTAYTYPRSTAQIIDATWVEDHWMGIFPSINQYVTSPDGLNWTLSDVVANSSGNSIAYGNGVIVVTTSGSYKFSTDQGQTFSSPTSFPFLPNGGALPNAMVRFGNGVFVAISANSLSSLSVCVSEDGMNWTPYTIPGVGTEPNQTTAATQSFTFDEGEFVAINTISGIFRSTDGKVWEPVPQPDLPIVASTQGGYTGFTVSSDTYNIGRFSFRPQGLNTATNLFNLGVTLNGTINNAGVTGLPAGEYLNYEGSITTDNGLDYQVQLSVNSEPVYTNSFSSALFSNSATTPLVPVGSSSLINRQCTVANGNTWLMQSGTAIQGSIDNLQTAFSTDLASFGVTANSGQCMIWTGSKYILFTPNVWLQSVDGVAWTVLDTTGLPNIAVGGSCFQQGDTILVSGAVTTTGFFVSQDAGETWNFSEAVPIIGPIVCVDGVWCAVSTTTQLVYSTDLETWTPFGSYSALAAASLLRQGVVFKGNGYITGYATSSPRVYRITVTEGIPEATVFVMGIANNSTNPYLAVCGDFLVAGWYRTGTNPSNAYSTDGENWTIFGSASGGAAATRQVLSNGYKVLRIFVENLGGDVYYPRYCDQEFYMQIGTGFNPVDDVVVTDFDQPNAGPQGECRILLMPDDDQVQAQWAPTPDTLTNIEAGTATPTSLTYDRWVEASEVGQKDVYGSNGFEVPAGLRPLAVQVEGTFERVFTNTPEARLGVQVGTESDTTPSVPIQSPLGSTTYLQKIVERNPDGDVSWTRETIANAQSTIEKTA